MNNRLILWTRNHSSSVNPLLTVRVIVWNILNLKKFTVCIIHGEKKSESGKRSDAPHFENVKTLWFASVAKGEWTRALIPNLDE